MQADPNFAMTTALRDFFESAYADAFVPPHQPPVGVPLPHHQPFHQPFHPPSAAAEALLRERKSQFAFALNEILLTRWAPPQTAHSKQQQEHHHQHQMSLSASAQDPCIASVSSAPIAVHASSGAAGGHSSLNGLSPTPLSTSPSQQSCHHHHHHQAQPPALMQPHALVAPLAAAAAAATAGSHGASPILGPEHPPALVSAPPYSPFAAFENIFDRVWALEEHQAYRRPTPFHASREPRMPLVDFVARLLRHMRCSVECFPIALALLDRYHARGGCFSSLYTTTTMTNNNGGIIPPPPHHQHKRAGKVGGSTAAVAAATTGLASPLFPSSCGGTATVVSSGSFGSGRSSQDASAAAAAAAAAPAETGVTTPQQFAQPQQQPARPASTQDARNAYRLIATALTVAAKSRDDRPYNNRHYADVCGVTVRELNALELAFLFTVRWEVHVSPEEYLEYEDLLLNTIAAQMREAEVAAREEMALAHAAAERQQQHQHAMMHQPPPMFVPQQQQQLQPAFGVSGDVFLQQVQQQQYVQQLLALSGGQMSQSLPFMASNATQPPCTARACGGGSSAVPLQPVVPLTPPPQPVQPAAVTAADVGDEGEEPLQSLFAVVGVVDSNPFAAAALRAAAYVDPLQPPLQPVANQQLVAAAHEEPPLQSLFAMDMFAAEAAAAAAATATATSASLLPPPQLYSSQDQQPVQPPHAGADTQAPELLVPMVDAYGRNFYVRESDVAAAAAAAAPPPPWVARERVPGTAAVQGPDGLAQLVPHLNQSQCCGGMASVATLSAAQQAMLFESVGFYPADAAAFVRPLPQRLAAVMAELAASASSASISPQRFAQVPGPTPPLALLPQ